ncbi:MAG: tyrosine-type recombinase/integrase, partial [Wenzhouxiangellaceae bacterium]
SVLALARYHRCSPDRLEPADVASYFRHLALERELAPASCRLHLNGIRYFYLKVLERKCFDVEVVIPKRAQRIPHLLTRAEVAQILASCSNTKHRMALTMSYGCGLRLSEVVALRVLDIDGERAQAHVVQGKGAKDRMVLLSAALLAQLRGYWQLYRPSQWLFPGREPMVALNKSSLQKAYTRAKARAGVEKVGGMHALRHAYATHQLEAGLPVHVLQRLLGHGSVTTTMRYVHWVPGYREGGVRHDDLIGALETVR